MSRRLTLTDQEARRLAEVVGAHSRIMLRNREPIDPTLDALRRKAMALTRQIASDPNGPRAEWKTVDEAADALGVSRRTIYRRISEGHLEWTLRKA